MIVTGGVQTPYYRLYYIYRGLTPLNQLTKPIMTKLTYAQQVKADRKAAALARRQDDYRQDAGFKAMYTKVEKPAKRRQAAILRRLGGRLANLKTIGRGYNDAHLFLLQALAANYTNEELLAKYQGQTAMIWALDRQMKNDLNLEFEIFDGLQDDAETGEITPFGALWVDTADIEFVKEYANNLVANYKATKAA